MTLRKTHITAISAIIYATCMAGVLAWVVYIVLTRGGLLEARMQTVADTNEKIKSYKELQMRVDESAEERTALSQFVLTEDETGSFLTEIERLGASQGVTLVTNSLNVNKQKDTPDVLQIQFELDGTEEQIKNMLNLFETLPYRSRVSALTLAKQDGGKVKSSISLEVTLLKYDR